MNINSPTTNDQNVIIEMLKKAPEMLKELYKNSTPEERTTILKILGGALGLVGFFGFLIKL